MATLKQREAAKKILENPGKPLGTIMREVGYSENTADNPKDLIESKGFRELAIEVGLTEDFLLKALHDDIKGKPKKRLGELQLAGKWIGLEKWNEAPASTENNTQINIIGGEVAQEFAEILAKRTKASDKS